MYTISVLGIKGGVGKSTVSILLSRELGKRGKKVLLLDRDMTGTVSHFFNLSNPGLFSMLAKNLTHNDGIYKTIDYENGGLITVAKLAGDSTDSLRAISLINKDKKLEERFSEEYERILRLFNFDCIIIDNHSLIGFDNPVAIVERKVRDKVYPNSIRYRMYISTLPKEVIDKTKDYIISVEHVRRTVDIFSHPYALVVNKVPENELQRTREYIKNAMKEINETLQSVDKKVVMGVPIKFYPNMPQILKGKDSNIDEIKLLADKICSTDLNEVVV